MVGGRGLNPTQGGGWGKFARKFAPPFLDFNLQPEENFLTLLFFLPFNIILSSNFPEKMNERKFRLHIFLQFSSTEIGIFPIYLL